MNINLKNINKNSIVIENEFNWLKKLIDLRLNYYFKDDDSFLNIPNAPTLNNDNSNYSKWIIDNKLSDIDRLIIVSSLANIYYPEIFDKFLITNKGLNKRFTEFGGKLDSENSRFIPTLGTISFIMYGRKFEAAFKLQEILNDNYVLNKTSSIIFSTTTDQSFASTTFSLSESLFQFITIGKKYRPNYNSQFPALVLKTELQWDELILSPVIMEEVENINTWIKYEHEISNNNVLLKKISKGYKCLFYGPPGTGKTLTATLLGKKNNKDVYRVDLSQIISKYVGETEKNLAQIFNIAENRDWILFFDEAESLFSKRTSVSDSKDKFANQQTAYLLQRIEDYDGLVILATNLKPNIDRAFSRRIQSQINFSVPEYFERRILWTNALSGLSNIDKKIIAKIAKDYIVTGGNIKNIIQYAWLLSKRNKTTISENELLIGIRRELGKEGKSVEI